jgi:hypothetical protein
MRSFSAMIIANIVVVKARIEPRPAKAKELKSQVHGFGILFEAPEIFELIRSQKAGTNKIEN